PTIPKFDGHYDHWCMLMENFMKSKEYWSIIADDILVVAEGNKLSEAQKKAIDEATLKDMKMKNYLFQAIGTARVQWAQQQALQKEYDVLSMTKGKFVNDYFAYTLNIAKIEDGNVIEKILRSMTPKFNYVVCSLEELKNLDVMTIVELQSSLLVHEQASNESSVGIPSLIVVHKSQCLGDEYVRLLLGSQLCGQKPNTLKPARFLFIRREGVRLRHIQVKKP
ncbi:hypothetical protein CR513_15480, partial [Mucuna pruriens]